MSKSEFNPQWVAGARRKDQSAITDLYNYCYQSVYLTTKSLIKSDEDTVLDILQDTFIKALTSLDQLGDDSKFPVWVKAIARNKSLDWLRRNQKIRFQPIDHSEDDEPEPQFEDDHIDFMPEVQLDQQETARLIREILDSLSDGQKFAVSMYYYQDMTIPEIAKAAGCSEGTIKAQLYKGRKKIEEKVRELEKKGTKLYGLMPFPFFTWLLRNMDMVPIHPTAEQLSNLLNTVGIGAAVGQGVQNIAASAGDSVSKTAAAQSVGTVGSTAVKTAGAVATHTAKGKIIAGILAAAVLGGAGGAAYVNHMNSAQEPDTNTPVAEQVPQNEPHPTPQSTASNETKSYHDLLNDLQNNGTFLQFAHSEDLNGDGTDELMIVHDDNQFSLYEYKDGEAKHAVDFQFEVSAMFLGDESVSGQTWADVNNVDVDFFGYPTLMIKMNPETKVLTFEDYAVTSWSEHQSQLYYENGEWVIHNYYTPEPDMLSDTDGGGEYKYYVDDREVSEEEWNILYKDPGADFGEGLDDQLSEMLSGEPVSEDKATEDATVKEAKAAYAAILRNHMNEHPEYSDTAVFQLIYADDDDVPELVIADQDIWGSGVALYTYIDGHAQPLGENLGSNGAITYVERENKILSSLLKDYGEATLYKIENGTLIPAQQSTVQIDSEGRETFTIDGKPASLEEGHLFWGWDDRVMFLSAGSGSGEDIPLNETNISYELE